MRESHVFKRDIYYLGVIDILQTWTWQKRIELWYKTWVLGKDGTELSAIEPGPYYERFVEKVNDIMISEQS